MAKVEAEYKIILTEDEALAFKRLLGSMTDAQFPEHGVSGDYRGMMTDVWNDLPCVDEE